MNWFSRKNAKLKACSIESQRLVFASTASLERGLDGSEETYQRYFFAIYHCSPDEVAGINHLRERLREERSDDVLEVGSRFVLSGEAAFLALTSYYKAMIAAETLSDDVRAYFKKRLIHIDELHRNAQALDIPGLTEGQLSHDVELEFLTCMALSNGQVFPAVGGAAP